MEGNDLILLNLTYNTAVCVAKESIPFEVSMVVT